MIDTLRLRLKNVDYMITSNKMIVIPEIKTIEDAMTLVGYNKESLLAKMPIINDETGEVKTKTIRGKKLVINDDFYNYTRIRIEHNEISELYDIVTCSIPKLINNNQINIGNYDSNKFKQGLENLKYKLEEDGIIVKDFYDSEITRLDLFNDVILQDKFMSYSDYFNSIQDGRKNKTNYNNETFLFHNKSTEFTIYDKIEELKNRKIDVSNLEPNIARCEARFKNKKTIQGIFKTNNLKNFNFDDSKKTLKSIGDKYFQNIGNFSVGYDIDSLFGNLELYKKLYPKTYFTNYLRDFALMIHKENLSYDGFMQILNDVFDDRKKLSKYKQIIDSINLPIRQIDKNKIYQKFVDDYYKNIA